MVTMRDVARRAEVSPKTVSRVFNDDPHVLPETRARVEAALQELNYVPNDLARTFRSGRARTVGVAVPSLADPFFATIVAAVDDEARQHDLSSVVTSLGSDAGREAELVEALLRTQVSGLVVAPISADHAYLHRWVTRVPTVFVDRPPIGVGTDYFIEDDHGGARAATLHLLDRGCRRVALLGDHETLPATPDRLAGYRAALAERGIADDPALVALDVTDRTRAEAALARILPAGPDAVFSTNARTSMAMMAAVQRTGLPHVGFGDFPMADVLTPSFTVVDQDPEMLGRLAARRVLERIAEPARRRRRKNVLAVRLVERDSCRLAVPDLGVVGAVGGN